VNPKLNLLQPYPFEKLRGLLASAKPLQTGLKLIDLSIGEPKHAAPECVKLAITNHLEGLSIYPSTKGDDALREAISQWVSRRYGLPPLNAQTQVLPALGSREAIFSFAQTVLDPTRGGYVVCPNPFYQIYEGAALLGGAQPYYVNANPSRHFLSDWASVPDTIWRQTQMLFVCSPGNPAGSVMGVDDWAVIFALADRYGFVIASDECYSEIYLDENTPPVGGLAAAHALGRQDYRGLVCFASLSKRSNLPGLRSGFVAGDAKLIEKFLLYRTYHGSAMSPVVSYASIAAWQDEAHVVDNRKQYRAKFDAVLPILQPHLEVERPDASFYLWAKTPITDPEFVFKLLDTQSVRVLPGSYVGRKINGFNPGANRIRIALVAPLTDCVEAAHRIAALAQKLSA
jgi:N-succinyldiaminopimelate aminotransferase